MIRKRKRSSNESYNKRQRQDETSVQGSLSTKDIESIEFEKIHKSLQESSIIKSLNVSNDINKMITLFAMGQRIKCRMSNCNWEEIMYPSSPLVIMPTSYCNRTSSVVCTQGKHPRLGLMALPMDMLSYIAGYLFATDLAAFCQVSRIAAFVCLEDYYECPQIIDASSLTVKVNATSYFGMW